jgi:phosphoribosylformylglycinamidine (FGAM) synthase-like enzyme
MAIELDQVPLRATNMTPAEVLSSESQERMCAVVTPRTSRSSWVCRKWDVATVIGEVTDGDRLQITWHGETVVDAAAHRRPRRPGLPASGGPSRLAGRPDRRHLRH